MSALPAFRAVGLRGRCARRDRGRRRHLRRVRRRSRVDRPAGLAGLSLAARSRARPHRRIGCRGLRRRSDRPGRRRVDRVRIPASSAARSAAPAARRSSTPSPAPSRCAGRSSHSSPPAAAGCRKGVPALAGMQRIAAAAERARTAGIAHVSVLRDPVTGGAWASLAAAADVVLALPGATVAFAGHRVRGASGADAFTAEGKLAHGQVDQVVTEPELRATLMLALELLTDGARRYAVDGARAGRARAHRSAAHGLGGGAPRAFERAPARARLSRRLLRRPPALERGSHGRARPGHAVRARPPRRARDRLRGPDRHAQHTRRLPHRRAHHPARRPARPRHPHAHRHTRRRQRRGRRGGRDRTGDRRRLRRHRRRARARHHPRHRRRRLRRRARTRLDRQPLDDTRQLLRRDRPRGRHRDPQTRTRRHPTIAGQLRLRPQDLVELGIARGIAAGGNA